MALLAANRSRKVVVQGARSMCRLLRCYGSRTHEQEIKDRQYHEGEAVAVWAHR